MFHEPSLHKVADNRWRSSDGLHHVTRKAGPDGWPCFEVTALDGSLVDRSESLDAVLRLLQPGAPR